MRGLATLPLAAAVLHAARRISVAAVNATLPDVPVVFTDWSRESRICTSGRKAADLYACPETSESFITYLRICGKK